MITDPVVLAVAMLAGVVGLLWLVELVRNRDARTTTDAAEAATRRSIQRLTGVLFGAATVVLVAWSELAAAVGDVGELVATFPGLVQSTLLFVLGGVGISGAVELSLEVYVAIALAIVLAVAMVRYS